jgi:hypothetical protein
MPTLDSPDPPLWCRHMAREDVPTSSGDVHWSSGFSSRDGAVEVLSIGDIEKDHPYPEKHRTAPASHFIPPIFGCCGRNTFRIRWLFILL